ncbi:MAG: hypothetical protein JXB38_20755 [Anaerolineales bacterium]|nr:hypothetical protein [Anaerolineales bacterium]
MDGIALQFLSDGEPEVLHRPGSYRHKAHHRRGLRGRRVWHPRRAMLRAEWRGAIRRQRRRTGHVKRGLLL